MQDALAERVITAMRTAPARLLPLPLVAAMLGEDPATLAAALASDPRFRVVRARAAVVADAAWPPNVARAYRAAFDRAGLNGTCVVLLTVAAPDPDPASTACSGALAPPAPGAYVAGLLADTLAALLPAAADEPLDAGLSRCVASAADTALALARLAPETASTAAPPADTSTTPPPAARRPDAARPRPRPG